jgi:PKD repeat protein
MKRTLGGTLLFLVVLDLIAPLFSIARVKGADPLAGEMPYQVIDFGNGTREAIMDFGNGTRNCIEETFVQNNTQLQVPNETDGSQISIPTSPPDQQEAAGTQPLVSSEDPSQYGNDNQTIEMNESMTLGFTYDLAYWQEQWNQSGGWWIFSWYLEVGATIDIQFGLRLPINVTLGYPDQMTVGNNYTIQATLNTTEPPNFNECLFVFDATIWAQAGLGGINLPRTVLFGPDIDYSQRFRPPLGSMSPPLFPNLANIDILGLIGDFLPQYDSVISLIENVVTPYLVVAPTFGSNSITAFANASGNAQVVQGANLNWTEPGETLNLTVNANKYDQANYTMLTLSDFRYYFTNFGLDFKLLFDFNPIINGFPFDIPDPELSLGTLDLSWLINYLGGARYVSSENGSPSSIYITLNVQGVITSQPQEDVAISYAAVSPSRVLLGQNVDVTIGATNLGNVTETFNVTTFANGTAIDEQPVVRLAPGEETMMSFNWTTTGLSAWDVYNITAEASEVPNIDTNNNVLFAGLVQIVLPNPNASFTYSPIPPILNQTVTFDASSSVSGSTGIAEYVWDFGEGFGNVTTTNSTATYVFAYAGNHKVTLTVIDSDGLNNTIVEVIDVLHHDVAMTNVTVVVPHCASKVGNNLWVFQGLPVYINATVSNDGDFDENVTVTLYYNVTASEMVGAQNVTLSPGQNDTVAFMWDTADVPYNQNYTMTAVATIPIDNNPADNILACEPITVRIVGDINGDGTVDGKDISILARSFGSYGPNYLSQGSAPSPTWNLDADINGDDVVDGRDLVLVARNFGK